jgi:glucans biosynthesis protein
MSATAPRFGLPLSKKAGIRMAIGESPLLRQVIAFFTAILIFIPAVLAADEPFSFEVLRRTARELAAKPYVAPSANSVPEWLRKLNYDEARLIEFDRNRNLWRRDGLPFQVQFFHPGNLYNTVVHLHEIRGGRVEPIEFRRDYFNYHQLKVGELPPTLGFAGFRLVYPLNHPDDELGAFLGASYFRFLCQTARYGISARGLALNSGEPTPEEFPIFTEFWIERPAPKAKGITIYALLDSESVTGAYRFIIVPGADTVMQIRAALFPRKNVAVFGVAPLTSMFWQGENSEQPNRDFRPEVHDSDGLLMSAGTGEWIWRPLVNPAAVSRSSFVDENPKGFGLLQRDRNFEHYQDIEAAYHLRPSAWVEPIGKWGKGSVRLVELPTKGEFADNIVAFWVPEKPPAPGETLEIEYRLHWFIDQIRPPAGYAIATRHGRGLAHESNLERFVLDFQGPGLNRLGTDAKIEHVVSVGDSAKLTYSSLEKNPFNGSWRVAFAIKPDGSGRPVELRCFLRQAPHALTETWSYLWQP